MSGFNVARNCGVPIPRLSRSGARSGATMAQRRSAAASAIPRHIGQRFFSPDTFIRSTATHQTLETPPPQIILFGADQVGYAITQLRIAEATTASLSPALRPTRVTLQLSVPLQRTVPELPQRIEA